MRQADNVRSARTAVAVAAALAALLAAVWMPGRASGQVGSQLTVTVTFADRIRPVGGSYYVPFGVNESLLQGPQADSTFWTHYLLYRGGRFFFGRVPEAPYRPFTFEAIRPPEPFRYGQILPDGRTLRAQIALSMLTLGPVPSRIKVNVVTTDDTLRPLDALGPGAGDRFGYVTLDLRRAPLLTLVDPTGDAPTAAFDITGGDIHQTTP